MLLKKRVALRIVLIAIGLLFFGFQNCSQVNFDQAPLGATAASISLPPDNSTTSYAWVSGGWNSCSATCGGGTQMQTVVCQRNDGVAVADSFCSGIKPPTSQICNIEACEVDHWVASGFGACSVSCGGGTQMQTVSCQNQDGTVVDHSRCSQPAPNTSQTCNTQACVTYAWKASGFGFCSAVCGGGTQTQSVICQDSNGNTVADNFCTTSKPPTAQTCNPQACLTYNWSAGGFGACSATCGGGTQTQSVVCKDSDGNTTNDSLCTGAKPATTQTCNPQACVTYSWSQGGWGICSATCGGGTQTQSVTCRDNNGNTVANSFCAGTPPPSTQSCNTQACAKPTWHLETPTWDPGVYCMGIANGASCNTPGVYCGAVDADMIAHCY